MRIYFTADLHLNHWTTEDRNIIKYCSRPFTTIEEMNQNLITNWNSLVQPEDLVYHLGDFCLRTSKELTAGHWESRLNGKIVHILGNHDYNNKVRGLQQAVIRFSKQKALLVHYPPTMIEEIPDFCNIVLCGHIHHHWKTKYLKDKLLINVGVDVWDYKPVSIDQILAEIQRTPNNIIIDETSPKAHTHTVSIPS